MREVLSSKIHNATVTDANLDYVGSITIDESLMERAGLWEGQKVMVVSNTTGVRLETYVIPGERDSGVMCINGAAAHQIRKGEQIIVMGFEWSAAPVTPRLVLVDEANAFVEMMGRESLSL